MQLPERGGPLGGERVRAQVNQSQERQGLCQGSWEPPAGGRRHIKRCWKDSQETRLFLICKVYPQISVRKIVCIRARPLGPHPDSVPEPGVPREGVGTRASPYVPWDLGCFTCPLWVSAPLSAKQGHHFLNTIHSVRVKGKTQVCRWERKWNRIHSVPGIQ